jgi:hypothetical protein
MTFPETLKTLSDDQLRKLERTLTLIASGKRDLDADQILRSLARPLTSEAQNLVDARTYELALTQPNLSYEALHAQALEDYKTGRLKPKRKRWRRRPQANQSAPRSPAYPPPAKTNPRPLQAVSGPVDMSECPPPNNDNSRNVIPFAGKCFSGGRSSSGGARWVGGETPAWPGNCEK